MPDCPRCHQPVDIQAINCPHCRTVLKAYGHPGIPLHRATDEEYLCQTCTYHLDDTCNFPQRPDAKECTLYQNALHHDLIISQSFSPRDLGYSIQTWLKRNLVWLVLIGLILVSLWLSL